MIVIEIIILIIIIIIKIPLKIFEDSYNENAIENNENEKEYIQSMKIINLIIIIQNFPILEIIIIRIILIILILIILTKK